MTSCSTNSIPHYKMNLKIYKISILQIILVAVVLATAVASLSVISPSINAHIGSAPRLHPSSTPSASYASSLDAPTKVVATGSRRTITVSWQEVAGATGYTIAVRPVNGTEPLAWREHSAMSSPHSISGKRVMSGLEYEVRVAALNTTVRSEWSDFATVSVPDLQPAPEGAIIPRGIPSYYVGQIMAVAMNGRERPFENRSVWHWFLCNIDGSDCKLLPVPQHTTYNYRVPSIARGKVIKVQVDYDKDGVSYSATDVVGSVNILDILQDEVIASVANKQVSVSWNHAPGATDYRVSIRPKDGTQPLLWSHYSATSSPHAIFGYWAMSGLKYEIQVSVVNADRRSESTLTTMFTGPERRGAPLGAIEILTTPPYGVGDIVHVSLASQYPFTDRSSWHWFLCDVNGSDCKLLPLKQTDNYKLVIPAIARGKTIKVQADYLKGPVSYTAKATIGTISLSNGVSDVSASMPTPVPDPADSVSKIECDEPVTPREDLFTASTTIESSLYPLQLERVHGIWGNEFSGAIEPICTDLLVVSPISGIAVVRPNGSVEYIDARVPMNLDELLKHPRAWQVQANQFRVADILLKQHSSKHWELFVTHHYFTGQCIRFRLSSTTIIRNGNDIMVSPAWRTIFDAEPCLPPSYGGGNHAGGRMLTDGADHLLVVTGDHGTGSLSQDPESHLGKLLRVKIETGDTEILASGLRNSQGLTRDAYGNLWGTDHGPQGGDELNLLKPGENYGWPIVTYGVGYGRVLNSPEVDRTGRHDGFTPPVFSWIPSIATSSIMVNNHQAFPLWNDDLLVASLTGYGNGLSLFRVRRDGTEIRYVERIDLGSRIRDMTQMPDGRIAMLIEDGGGFIYFLSRDYSYCYDDNISNEDIYKIDCESETDSVSKDDEVPDTTDDATEAHG